MSGTRTGGLKSAQILKEKDPLHFKKIGAKGGANGHTGGFATDHFLAKEAGRKGGLVSRRSSPPIEDSEKE